MSAKEAKAIREAAASLHDVIMAGRAVGLTVQWPSRSEDLPTIAISETKKAAVTVSVNTPPEVSPETTAKATTAAQKAADRTVERAAEKG